MRVLLDEQIDVVLRHQFSDDFQAETVEYRDWKSLDNGALLEAAAAEYEAFVTNDQGIPHQQSLHDTKLRFIVFDAPTNRIEDHEPLVPLAEEALRTMAPGDVRRVEAPA